jgi:hypothetical protein
LAGIMALAQPDTPPNTLVEAPVQMAGGRSVADKISGAGRDAHMDRVNSAAEAMKKLGTKKPAGLPPAPQLNVRG